MRKFQVDWKPSFKLIGKKSLRLLIKLQNKVLKNEIKMPLDDSDADMYYHIVDILKKNGYKHYEIS